MREAPIDNCNFQRGFVICSVSLYPHAVHEIMNARLNFCLQIFTQGCQFRGHHWRPLTTCKQQNHLDQGSRGTLFPFVICHCVRQKSTSIGGLVGEKPRKSCSNVTTYRSLQALGGRKIGRHQAGLGARLATLAMRGSFAKHHPKAGWLGLVLLQRSS